MMIKKVIAAICLMFCFNIGFAQNNNGEATNTNSKKPTKQQRAQMFLKRYVSIWDTTTNQKIKDRIYLNFSDLVKFDSTNWLSNYYAAYSFALNAVEKQTYHPNKVKDIHRALNFISKAEQLEANNSEVVLMRGMILDQLMDIDSSMAGKYTKEVAKCFEKAQKLNADNPRIYLELAKKALKTDPAKGKESASALCKTALEKYKAWKEIDPALPHWGKKETEALAASLK